jgi:hypothetical protein
MWRYGLLTVLRTRHPLLGGKPSLVTVSSINDIATLRQSDTLKTTTTLPTATPHLSHFLSCLLSRIWAYLIHLYLQVDRIGIASALRTHTAYTRSRRTAPRENA